MSQQEGGKSGPHFKSTELNDSECLPRASREKQYIKGSCWVHQIDLSAGQAWWGVWGDVTSS